MGTAGDTRAWVIDHIVWSELKLAAILGVQRVDAEVADRLREVLEHLDAALTEIRNSDPVVATDDPDPRMESRLRAVPVFPARRLRAVPKTGPQRRLSGVTSEAVFAYATYGHDFYRLDDNSLWAHESEDLLLSARSGIPLAHRVGDVFYDIETDTPLYREDAHAAGEDGN